MSAKDLDNIIVAKNVEQALDIIDQTRKAFDEGGGQVCVNAKVYQMSMKKDVNENLKISVTDKN